MTDVTFPEARKGETLGGEREGERHARRRKNAIRHRPFPPLLSRLPPPKGRCWRWSLVLSLHENFLLFGRVRVLHSEPRDGDQELSPHLGVERWAGREGLVGPSSPLPLSHLLRLRPPPPFPFLSWQRIWILSDRVRLPPSRGRLRVRDLVSLSQQEPEREGEESSTPPLFEDGGGKQRKKSQSLLRANKEKRRMEKKRKL